MVRIEFIEEEVRIHVACPKTDRRSAKLVSIRPCLQPVLAQHRVRWCACLGSDGRRRGRGSSSPLQPLLFSLQLSLSLSLGVSRRTGRRLLAGVPSSTLAPTRRPTALLSLSAGVGCRGWGLENPPLLACVFREVERGFGPLGSFFLFFD